MPVLTHVLGSLNEPNPAHDVVTVFHPKYLSDLFRNCDAAAGYDFGEKGNVLFVHLNRQRNLAEGQQTE